MKGMAHFRYMLIAFAVLVSACTPGEKGNILTIATAANLQFVMAEITNNFSAETGIDCALVIGSSGKLTAQIREGAPFDMFVAANMKYPEEIYRSGLARTPPKAYAYGRLVLWSMHAQIAPSMALLTSDTIAHIALANPETAPYGAAAVEALNHYNIYEVTRNKLVFGESIAQTNQFITSRAAEVGFTAMSVVLSPEMAGKGKWVEIDTASYTRIEQGIVIIRHDQEENTAATDFYAYLFSDAAEEVLKHFGYFVHE